MEDKRHPTSGLGLEFNVGEARLSIPLSDRLAISGRLRNEMHGKRLGSRRQEGRRGYLQTMRGYDRVP